MLAQFGYDGAKKRLKEDAVPDVPLVNKKVSTASSQPTKPRGAYMKRQKADVS
jgi:hypothetical protein